MVFKSSCRDPDGTICSTPNQFVTRPKCAMWLLRQKGPLSKTTLRRMGFVELCRHRERASTPAIPVRAAVGTRAHPGGLQVGPGEGRMQNHGAIEEDVSQLGASLRAVPRRSLPSGWHRQPWSFDRRPSPHRASSAGAAPEGPRRLEPSVYFYWETSLLELRIPVTPSVGPKGPKSRGSLPSDRGPSTSLRYARDERTEARSHRVELPTGPTRAARHAAGRRCRDRRESVPHELRAGPMVIASPVRESSRAKTCT